MTSVLVILALMLHPPSAEKKRNWMEGQVLDVKFRQDTWVPTASGRDGGGMTAPPVYTSYYTYIVLANGVRYELEEQVTAPRFKTGDTAKFAIEKKNCFFLDEKGKEKKGELKGTKKVP
jgi:hypothetical protein